MLKDLLTEKDGVSFCPVRILFVAGFLAIIVFTIQDIASGQHFMEHVGDWIKGLAQYLGLGGGAIAGKNYTESNT